MNTKCREKYFMTAMREGLAAMLTENSKVIILGEDVERGVIGATRQLINEFGEQRIKNTPISEAGFIGSAIGAAAVGVYPVIDLMYSSFLYVAMDQIANQAAKLRYMSGGQVEIPLTIFANTGLSGGAAAQHSESPHPLLMNLPGIKVVMPSNPYDAKGLMIAAIREPNPVIYLQDGLLAGSKGVVPEQVYEVPLGRAQIKRNGTDATLVAIGILVNYALTVAEKLEVEQGISIEVIDPRTLSPLDMDSIFTSVEKTGRLLVCDNARLTCSLASEIVASVSENRFSYLHSSPRRVALENVPIPFSPVLEQAVAVTELKIEQAITELFKNNMGKN